MIYRVYRSLVVPRLHLMRCVFIASLSFALLNSDTAYCKLLQAKAASTSISLDDPFSDNSNPAPDPFAAASTPESAQSIKQSHLINPQLHFSSEQVLGKPSTRSRADEVLDEMQKIGLGATYTTRPIYPQRTQPGGLISSTCVDPFMSGRQEMILWAELQRLDDTDWDDFSLDQLLSHLRQRLPLRINLTELESEGIKLSQKIDASNLLPGPVGARMQSVLAPLELGYECRSGAIVISPESCIEDGYGQKRIYDVTPLVSQVRGGSEQLINSITQSIETDNWLNHGGNNVLNAHVVPAGDHATIALIVNAPFRVHRDILELLDRLNELSVSKQSKSDLNQLYKSNTAPSKFNSLPNVEQRTQTSEF